MSSVDVAADYAAKLIASEAHGSGDTEPAMRRLEQKFGVGYWLQWSLRYRRPKAISADNFQRLRNAYLATCERQLVVLAHELGIERASGNDSNADLETETEALLAKLRRAKSAARGG